MQAPPPAAKRRRRPKGAPLFAPPFPHKPPLPPGCGCVHMWRPCRVVAARGMGCRTMARAAIGRASARGRVKNKKNAARVRYTCAAPHAALGPHTPAGEAPSGRVCRWTQCGGGEAQVVGGKRVHRQAQQARSIHTRLPSAAATRPSRRESRVGRDARPVTWPVHQGNRRLTPHLSPPLFAGRSLFARLLSRRCCHSPPPLPPRTPAVRPP